MQDGAECHPDRARHFARDSRRRTVTIETRHTLVGSDRSRGGRTVASSRRRRPSAKNDPPTKPRSPQSCGPRRVPGLGCRRGDPRPLVTIRTASLDRTVTSGRGGPHVGGALVQASRRRALGDGRRPRRAPRSWIATSTVARGRRRHHRGGPDSRRPARRLLPSSQATGGRLPDAPTMEHIMSPRRARPSTHRHSGHGGVTRAERCLHRRT